MPLVRSRSQSSSTPQSLNVLTGFRHWRRRRTSNTVPSSPLATSVTTNNTDSFPASANLSRSSSEHSIRPSRLYHHTITTDEEHRTSLLTDSFNALSNAMDSLASGTNRTTFTTAATGTTAASADMEATNTTCIRLLPSVELTSRCFVFDIIDRILTPSTLLKIGRHSERHSMSDRLSFKSKVVSRSHAELWMELDKKIFIRDIGSSSGTFINRVRLSRSNETSQPMELRDGDIIQLGADYQGDYQDEMDQMYRAVKIRLEINRDSNKTSSFSRHAFQQFRQHLLGVSLTNLSSDVSNRNSNRNNSGSGQLTLLDGGERSSNRDDGTTGLPGQHTDHISNEFAYKGHNLLGQKEPNHTNHQNNTPYIQECCICLYDIAPLQALFIAPCSHVYHFKCLRPIIYQHYPGFSCPMCRNYYDLEATVAIEASEVVEKMGLSTLDVQLASTVIQSTTASPILSVPPPTSDTKSTAVAPSPISTTSSMMHYYSPSPSLSLIQQNNHDREGDSYVGGERQHQNQRGRRADRQTLFTGHMDGHILSSTLVDSSMMEQDGVYGNGLSSL